MHYINMIDITRESYERIGAKTNVNSEGILQSNEKHVQGRLGHKNLWMTVKCPPDYRKHRNELIDGSKKEPNSIFMRQELATKVIMDWKNNSST